MRSRRERGILILILALSVGLIMLGVFIMGQYEYSVLTSYAKQQDSYVKLVLDQINLQADRSDDEIIENILASLGNGDTSYWAFSKEQTILYIKNVTETYQYKGITMESYFSSNTASEFLNSLRLNQVTHAIVNMGDDQYVASGVIFKYDGNQYKICLLTDQTVILSDNAFLSAKILMYIFWIALIIIALLMSVFLLIERVLRKREIEEEEASIQDLNLKLEKAESEVQYYRYYSPENNVYTDKMLPLLIDSLRSKGAKQLSMLTVEFPEERLTDDFLHNTADRFGKRVLRFKESDKKASLLFVNVEQAEAKEQLERLLPPEVKITDRRDMMAAMKKEETGTDTKSDEVGAAETEEKPATDAE